MNVYEEENVAATL